MNNTPLIKVKTITEYHKLMGHPNPLHPLITVINLGDMKAPPFAKPTNLVYDFYCITLKKNTGLTFKYGQHDYDFNDGTLFFMAPQQVFGFQSATENTEKPEGWALLFHPDFIWNTSLASTIKNFEYFDYAVNEALHISDKEKQIVTRIVTIIEQEYQSNIDKFSQDIIIGQIESLLNYADRFYQRQFIIRKKINHQILDQLENLLADYFTGSNPVELGLPTVQYISSQLHISPNYLSRLLTTLTQKSTKQFIQDKIIEIAKQKLSITNLSIKEIAFELGFEHPQSFNKLFKSNTAMSPLEFRMSFN